MNAARLRNQLLISEARSIHKQLHQQVRFDRRRMISAREGVDCGINYSTAEEICFDHALLSAP